MTAQGAMQSDDELVVLLPHAVLAQKAARLVIYQAGTDIANREYSSFPSYGMSAT